jgi:hypothetical protein
MLGEQEVVFANVSRPEPGQALAIHQVRLQLVDIAGKLLPLEQVYRSYMVLSADNGTRPDANNNNNNTADRTLVALGPEGSKESVRLPRGYYILSHQVSRVLSFLLSALRTQDATPGLVTREIHPRDSLCVCVCVCVCCVVCYRKKAGRCAANSSAAGGS